jgi:chromosome segregation and condensation protein ScpB
MVGVEAVIFVSAEPVSRETLAQAGGKDCSIDLLIDDLREELSSRPYELVSVASGSIEPARGSPRRSAPARLRQGTAALSEFEAMVLMAVGYFQPITRGKLSKIFGKEVSRDTIGSLRGAGFISSGPRSPAPGAPYTFATTKHFLSAFGFDALRDLPDIEALEDDGLLSRTIPYGDDISVAAEEFFDGEEDASVDFSVLRPTEGDWSLEFGPSVLSSRTRPP